jgi:nucleoid DNA-binding protein
MRTRNWLALGTLVGTLALVLATVPPARSQKPPAEEGVPQQLARATKLTEEQASKFYAALGPILSAEIRKGKTVSLPGLGTFRVVRIAAHRDLVDGRPVVIPARNTIEFIGGEELIGAANSEGAVPSEEVPAFEYIPLPGQTPGQKTGPVRTSGVRTR